jgi:hypothetical protein
MCSFVLVFAADLALFECPALGSIGASKTSTNEHTAHARLTRTTAESALA